MGTRRYHKLFKAGLRCTKTEKRGEIIVKCTRLKGKERKSVSTKEILEDMGIRSY